MANKFKYISRFFRNGHWNYVYPEENTKQSGGPKVKRSTTDNNTRERPKPGDSDYGIKYRLQDKLNDVSKKLQKRAKSVEKKIKTAATKVKSEYSANKTKIKTATGKAREQAKVAAEKAKAKYEKLKEQRRQHKELVKVATDLARKYDGANDFKSKVKLATQYALALKALERNVKTIMTDGGSAHLVGISIDKDGTLHTQVAGSTSDYRVPFTSFEARGTYTPGNSAATNVISGPGAKNVNRNNSYGSNNGYGSYNGHRYKQGERKYLSKQPSSNAAVNIVRRAAAKSVKRKRS